MKLTRKNIRPLLLVQLIKVWAINGRAIRIMLITGLFTRETKRGRGVNARRSVILILGRYTVSTETFLPFDCGIFYAGATVNFAVIFSFPFKKSVKIIT